MNMLNKINHNLKVGQLVTAYRKGFHVITEIERRFYTEYDVKYYAKTKKVGEEYNPLVYYRQVAKSNGQLVKGKTIYSCDIAYVAPVSLDDIKEKARRKVKLVEEMIENVSKMLKESKV